jgi:hypothetical protein
VNAAAAEVNYTDGEHPLDRLRFRLHGQTAPVTAQLMYLGYYQLPLEVTKHPSSRDYKQALREMFASLGQIQIPGPALRIFDADGEITPTAHLAPPTLGQHTAEVLAWLDE